MKLKRPSLVDQSTSRVSSAGSGISLLLHTALLDDPTSLLTTQMNAPAVGICHSTHDMFDFGGNNHRNDKNNNRDTNL